MAIYRMVSMAFWTDSKVVNDFTAEDRYFYLYLFTNPHTNLCGCYEISIKQISNEMGYTRDGIENLIGRFEKTHDVIRFCKETNEILLLNWSKYNWTNSEKFKKPLSKEIRMIKCQQFRDYLQRLFDGEECEFGIPYRYRIDTTCIDTTDSDSVTESVTVTDSETDKNNKDSEKLKNKEIIKRVIDYLNSRTGSRYRASAKSNSEGINARLSEGYEEDDFYIVIDNKVNEWTGTEYEKYLNPTTLFAPSKFEKYLNQKTTARKNDINADRQSQLNYLLNDTEEGEVP